MIVCLIIEMLIIILNENNSRAIFILTCFFSFLQQWLEPNKKVGKQLKPKKGDLKPDAHTLYFCVKFYATDPCKLFEEITRYVMQYDIFFTSNIPNILKKGILISRK